MPQKKDNLRAMAEALIDATNAFDVERALALFTQEAVIDNPPPAIVSRAMRAFATTSNATSSATTR